MKKYLQTKLYEIVDKIEQVQKSILTKVAEGNFNNLKENSDHILRLEERRSELTKDIVINLSIEEVIEINERKDIFGNYIGSPFKKYALEYSYKSSTKVSISQRDFLVATFGYSFKDIPVK